MSKTLFISQSLVKRRCAAALATGKDRNGWSDSDTADALGVCRATIQNRLDADDPGKQMTIHELLRSLQHDVRIANDILGLAGFKVEPIEPVRDESCDRRKHSSILRASYAISLMLEDESISDGEIRDNRKTLEEARDSIDRLLSRVGPKGEVA